MTKQLKMLKASLTFFIQSEKDLGASKASIKIALKNIVSEALKNV